MLNEIVAQRERECLACSTSVYIHSPFHLFIPSSEMTSMAVSRAITTRTSGTPQLVDSHLRTVPLTLSASWFLSNGTDLKPQAANVH